jgi:predicted AAA+ superfamily ATPase
MSEYCIDFADCRRILDRRLEEPAPGRVQLLTGPRQVGKTTLLLELQQRNARIAVYGAADGPEAAVPGFWERLWTRTEEVASREGRAILLLDEAHLVPDWAARLKGEWDRLRRRKLRIHVIATGSSALRLATGSRESLAGRFERLTLAHWSAAALAEAFQLAPEETAEAVVRMGSYPGAFPLRGDVARCKAYVRDAIVEPAIGRDILALSAVRKPALLRQVFGAAVSSPAEIVSLQKIQGQLQDRGALETVAHYLQLLEEAFLVAPLGKYSPRPARQRSAPPKLVTLNNALLAAIDPRGIPDASSDPKRFGRWVENACLAHLWNRGQRVSYWREEPYEIDAVVDGTWGSWAVQVTAGWASALDLHSLGEFTRRYPKHQPLVVSSKEGRVAVERAGFPAMAWSDFLFSGLRGRA